MRRAPDTKSSHNLREKYRDLVLDCVYDELAVKARTDPQEVAVLDISTAGGFGFPGHWLIREWLSGVVLRVRPAGEPPTACLGSAIDDASDSIQRPLAGIITDGSPDVVRYFENRQHWFSGTNRPILHVPLAPAGSSYISASERSCRLVLARQCFASNCKRLELRVSGVRLNQLHGFLIAPPPLHSSILHRPTPSAGEDQLWFPPVCFARRSL